MEILERRRMNLVKNWPSKIAGTAIVKLLSASRFAGAVVVNLLTLSRLAFTVGFLAFVLGGEPRLAILMLAGVYGSDILDGFLARKWKVTTRFGACFDLVSDIFLVLLSYQALVIAGSLPMWMLPMAMLKFAEFISTSYILSGGGAKGGGDRSGAEAGSGIPSRFSPVFDRIGRLSGILYMCVPTAVMLLMRFDSYMDMTVPIAVVSLSVCLLAAVSSIHRIGRCFLAVRSCGERFRASSSKTAIM